MENRATGSIPSPADYRDLLAARSVFDALAAVAPTLPESFKIEIKQLGEVLDQNKINACVSHAWALVMKYWWWKTTGEIVNFSPRFLDILSNETWIPIDGGRVPRTVCKVSAVYGCCTTKLLPNDTENLTHAQYRDKSVITQAMYDEAKKYRIPGYVRVPDDTKNDFRTAVHQFGLVSGLFAISDAFWKPSWDAKDILPLKAQASSSNHQMVVFGWESVLNVLRNSWSKFWANNGNGSYDPQAWLPFVYEGWAIATIPTDVKTWLSSLPPQKDFAYQWQKNMSRGDYNDDVKFAQVALMILGYLEPVDPWDLGHYGPKTEKGVLKYQTARGIYPPAPDSIGPKTRAALNKDFAL